MGRSTQYLGLSFGLTSFFKSAMGVIMLENLQVVNMFLYNNVFASTYLFSNAYLGYPKKDFISRFLVAYLCAYFYEVFQNWPKMVLILLEHPWQQPGTASIGKLYLPIAVYKSMVRRHAFCGLTAKRLSLCQLNWEAVK